ncbi:MAG TPA: NAD(P)/FAD-dependent oxidoreductase [Actinomycetota bacterium]|nr:NAD(P)/FAD-dependent oxidoreductase [Actinomycetota bacterium]
MERYDVFVIGGGGTGSEVAFSLSRRSKLKIGLAERDKLGGECNHYGCVPTKVMLRSAKVAAWGRGAGRFGVRIPSVEVDFPAVMARARKIIDDSSGGGAKPFIEQGIEVLFDEVRLVGPHRLETSAGQMIEAEHIVIATGTEATAPPIEGLEGAPYWTNREALWSPTEVPSSVTVLGSGPIGIEFAQIYARFGAKVTVVELFDRIMYLEDEDSSTALIPALEEDGIELITSAKTKRVSHGPDGWTLEIEGRDHLHTQELLVATGRKPCFDEHDLDAAGVQMKEGKPVLDETLRTTGDKLWAAGDATGDLLFTHVGSYEAEIVVDDILGTRRPRDYRVVPKVTYCEPEVASVGHSEKAAREEGHEVVTSLVKIGDNERAVIEGAEHGIVKLVADKSSGELLGGHIVSETAGDMIHEVVAAMAGHIPIEVVGEAIHSYPTLSETVKGAFLQLAANLR